MKNKKIGILQLCFLILLLLSVSCENPKTSNENSILECIIDNYSKINKVAKTDYLSIRDNQNWTDSTSIIVITTLPKEGRDEIDVLVANYGRIEIRMIRGTLNKSKKSVNDNWISTYLDWRKNKKEKSKIPDENYIPILNHPDEIQLVYNPKSNCIQEIILGNEEVISQTMRNCKKCN
jgi:hypothetical protein